MERKIAILDVIDVDVPCHADWGKMPGNETVRHCPTCDLKVYDLSSMMRDEAETLLRQHQGPICVRLLRSFDGATITADGPGHRKGIRRRMARLAATLLALLGFPSCVIRSMGSVDVAGIRNRPNQERSTAEELSKNVPAQNVNDRQLGEANGS